MVYCWAEEMVVRKEKVSVSYLVDKMEMYEVAN
jgi:hypothetical protein